MTLSILIGIILGLIAGFPVLFGVGYFTRGWNRALGQRIPFAYGRGIPYRNSRLHANAHGIPRPRRVSVFVAAAAIGGISFCGVGGLGRWQNWWLMAWGEIFLLFALVDLESRRVPNPLVLACGIAALTLSLAGFGPRPLNALMGGTVGFVIFFVLALVQRGAMGMGDVKFAGLVGLLTGYPGVLAALAVGIIAGGLGALVLLLMRHVGRKSYIPYVPFLAAGAWLLMLYAAHGMA